MRSGPKNLVSKVLRCALGLALRSGYTSLVVSTGKVRPKAQRSGLGTKGEVRLRIIWVKVFASPENSCREQLDGYATFDLLLPQRNETSPSHDQMVEQSEA